MKYIQAFSILLIYLISNTFATAQCLEASDELNIDIQRTHAGLITASWSVDVSNQCDSPYDGTLRVRFFVEGYNMPRETVNIIILQARESDEVAGTINLPVDDLSRIKRTDVAISERERPI